MPSARKERGVVVTMEFPLPECREEFEAASHGADYKAVLQELDEWLRREIKHGSQYDHKALDAARTYLYECLEGRNLTLHD